MTYHAELLDDAFLSESKYAEDGARHTYLSLLEEYLNKREAEGLRLVGIVQKHEIGTSREVDAMLVFHSEEGEN